MHSGLRLLLILVLSLSASTATAAPEDQFYEHDYAAHPEVMGTAIEGSEKIKITPAPLQIDGNSSNKPTKEQNDSIKEHASSTQQTRNRRIIALVYVNSLDANHFNQLVQEVFRLYDNRLIFIQAVYHLGTYLALTPELKREFAKRNIVIEQAAPPVAPPEGMNVLLSPSWLLATKEGVHIVEGEMSLKKYIDDFGEFQPQQTAPSAQITKSAPPALHEEAQQ